MERIGDYTVEREIRREDGSTTYKAVHLVLPRHAAVRVLNAGSKAIAVQLLREACILEALSHPGVPRVFECGVADGRPWVAMELVEGPTLGELCREGPLAIADLVLAIRTIAEVLEHAHARGVIHQRLGEAAVVRAQGRHSPFTVVGWGGVGTRDGVGNADSSRDVHALGTVAFRALTATAHTPGASARAQAPSAPNELAELIDDMLTPTRRPTATEARERASWLADTVVPRKSTQEMRPLEPTGTRDTTFSIRINRG
ncbi:MAG TPA: protein kinase [Kofleriaceae bacterium]